MSAPDRFRGRGLVVRLAVWAAVVLAAGGAGLFWRQERAAASVDATATLALAGALRADGQLEVREELVILEAEDTVQRLLPAPDGLRWRGVTDATGRPVDHTTVPVADGLLVTVPLGTGTALLNLAYDLAGTVHEEADGGVEVRWPIADDRSPVAIAGLQLDLGWTGGGEAVDVALEGPGADPTVVPRDGGLRLTAGQLAPHRPVTLHAVLPGAAAEGAAPEAEDEGGSRADEATVPGEASPTGGGPAWLPVLVAVAFLSAWGVLHRRQGREPEATARGPVTARPTGHSPAEVGWLLRRGAVEDVDVVATVVDLHERGLLTVDGPVWRLTDPTGPPAGVVAHEQVVLDWLFADGPSLDTHERAGRIREEPGTWRRFWRTFTGAVGQAGAGSGLVQTAVDAERVVGAGLVAASVVVAGVIGTARGQPLWLLCVAAGALAMVFTDTLARRSPEGADAAAAWTAFADHLRADWAAVDPVRGHALVLGVRGVDTLTVRAVADTFAAYRELFVAATSYDPGPGLRRLLPW